jgi:transcriptional regulator with XRE-family HTH domain
VSEGDQRDPLATAGVWERNFRDRMIRMRKAKGMNQTDLARALRNDFGLPFHQQTIQRIESGERPIRLNEANLIAETLGAGLDVMMSDIGSPESVRLNLELASQKFYERADKVAEYLNEQFGAVETLYEELQTAWEAYVSTQDELGEPIDEDLNVMMGRFDSRYERAQRGLGLLTELGDL